MRLVRTTRTAACFRILRGVDDLPTALRGCALALLVVAVFGDAVII
jgi:hypothetical protein